ncbi:unnamed protein product [Strongylus vulgaris]|uniref:Cadherin domain-containing protein n=1 Tax=Strongylus vulgaris TaxID=40348 RepID=A0A3P7JUX2_STRVU|nr:unnamed protein product [Strongylus vulgaris]
MPPATYQYILTGPGATIFAVDQRGYLYLNVPQIDADPPKPSSYRLNVQAREVDTMPIRSSEPVTIIIHVMDTNDNAPQFEQPIYTVNVTSFGDERPMVKVLATDPDSGTFGDIQYRILQVLATDPDSGTFGDIQYRILQVTNGGDNKFRYDQATNTLYATGDLTPGERYQIVIEAEDGGGKTSQAIVVALATHTMFSLASIAPLPGMETFIPNPAAYMTTLSTPTSAGKVLYSLNNSFIHHILLFVHIPIVVALATHTMFSLASIAPLPGMETFIPNPAAYMTTPSTPTSAEQDETIQTFVTEVAENTPINTVVVSLGVRYLIIINILLIESRHIYSMSSVENHI